MGAGANHSVDIDANHTAELAGTVCTWTPGWDQVSDMAWSGSCVEERVVFFCLDGQPEHNLWRSSSGADVQRVLETGPQYLAASNVLPPPRSRAPLNPAWMTLHA